MFDRFFANFQLVPASQSAAPPWIDDRVAGVAGYEALVATAAGCSFENGLYRLHSEVSGRKSHENVLKAFPDLAAQFWLFAFDWLGRQLALDFGRVEKGEPLVLMLEPGTGEALEIPATFVSFHDEEIVDFRDAALASDFFARWSAFNPTSVPLSFSDCVGYRVPLFLGGRDALENLEVTDMDVYWTMLGQMRRAVADRSPGTRIRGVSIDE